VFLLWSPPVVDAARRDGLVAPDRTILVEPTRAWLHAPGGIGRLELAGLPYQVTTGTQMTARNLNALRKPEQTLDALRMTVQMLDEPPAD